MDTPDTPDTPEPTPLNPDAMRKIAHRLMVESGRLPWEEDRFTRAVMLNASADLLEHARYQSHVAQQMEALLAQLGPAADAIAAGGIGGALGLLRAVQQG